MSTRVARNKSASLPRTFRALNELHRLRPIHDECEYESARDLAERILLLPASTPDQMEYLETLSILLDAYEREHHAIDTAGINAIEVLKFLLDQHGMTASDLGRLLGNRSVGSAILRGERQLSKRHIARLAAHFRVNPSLFLPATAAV